MPQAANLRDGVVARTTRVRERWETSIWDPSLEKEHRAEPDGRWSILSNGMPDVRSLDEARAKAPAELPGDRGRDRGPQRVPCAHPGNWCPTPAKS